MTKLRPQDEEALGRHAAAKLPAAKPKRTGRRGVGPVDREVPAGNDLTLTSPGTETEEEEEEAEEVAVARVEKGMVLMNFVKAIPTRDKKTNERFVSLHISAILSPEGAELFSEPITRRYNLMIEDEGLTDQHFRNIPQQMLDIARPEDGKNVLHEPVQPTKVGLATIEQKGSGEAVKGIRLSFVAPIKQTDAVLLWAGAHHGELVWIKMQDSQSKMKMAK
jgi:hypothetical protein